MTHTPEPWKAHAGHNHTIYAGAVAVAFTSFGPGVDDDANASRIVKCVNACAGMEDPGAEIERLERIEVAALALLNCHTGASWQTQGIRDRAFRDLSAAVDTAEGGSNA